MELGILIGTWDGSATMAEEILTVAREAEALGYGRVWVPELYGADAVTLMTWIAAHTSRITVASAIMQMPARSAAMTAMTAASLDLLSGGRFELGLGLSGPVVSEGWYGEPWPRSPLARTRDYVEIVRRALTHEKVAYEGQTLQLPLPGGEGRPIRMVIRPQRRVPIWLAAIGPKNTALTGEIADGWLPAMVIPERLPEMVAPLREGERRAGREPGAVRVNVSTGVVVTDDLVKARNIFRPYVALLVGGMGSKQHNFYNRLVRGFGYDDEAGRIQDLYLAGKRAEAEALVPDSLIDSTYIFGPRERIAERLAVYRASGADVLSINPSGRSLAERIAVMQLVAELVL